MKTTVPKTINSSLRKCVRIYIYYYNVGTPTAKKSLDRPTVTEYLDAGAFNALFYRLNPKRNFTLFFVRNKRSFFFKKRKISDLLTITAIPKTFAVIEFF